MSGLPAQRDVPSARAMALGLSEICARKIQRGDLLYSNIPSLTRSLLSMAETRAFNIVAPLRYIRINGRGVPRLPIRKDRPQIARSGPVELAGESNRADRVNRVPVLVLPRPGPPNLTVA